MDRTFAKEQTLRSYPHFALGLVAAQNRGVHLSPRAFVVCVVGYVAFTYVSALIISAAGDWYLRREGR